MANHDNLIHATLIPSFLPPSRWTGRPYTSASVYRWFNIGRLTRVQVGGAVYAFRTEVDKLNKEMEQRAKEAIVA